jgi:SAM-dependent methyltransferase
LNPVLPFELPVPAALAAIGPQVDWNGTSFMVGGNSLPLLEYSENFAGWSDDLTFLHESAAGSQHPIDRASRRDACAQVRRWVTAPDPVILEVGCSSGFLLQDLRQSMPRATLLGADVVREPLLALSRRLPGVPLLRFDLLKSPIPAGVLDGLVMLNVLEHIEDDRAALAAVARMLKPGGHVIIEVPAGPALYDDYDRALRHFRRYDMAALQRLIDSAGLQTVRSTHLGFLLYPAFAWTKRRNQRRSAASGGGSVSQAVELVAEQASRTSRSPLMEMAFAIEDILRDRLPQPCGIRCLVVARKPSAGA